YCSRARAGVSSRIEERGRRHANVRDRNLRVCAAVVGRPRRQGRGRGRTDGSHLRRARQQRASPKLAARRKGLAADARAERKLTRRKKIWSAGERRGIGGRRLVPAAAVATRLTRDVISCSRRQPGSVLNGGDE